MSRTGNSTISFIGRTLLSGYGSTLYSSGVRQFFTSEVHGEMSNFSVPEYNRHNSTTCMPAQHRQWLWHVQLTTFISLNNSVQFSAKTPSCSVAIVNVTLIWLMYIYTSPVYIITTTTTTMMTKQNKEKQQSVAALWSHPSSGKSRLLGRLHQLPNL